MATKTVREIVDEIKSYGGKDRIRWLLPLMESFCPVSIATIREKQRKMVAESEGDYKKFCEMQDEVILECVQLEISEIGLSVREICKLEPLTWDTEIPEASPEQVASQQPKGYSLN